MDDTIEVSIEFYGHFNKITGKKQEKVKISSGLKEGIDDICKYLKETYFITQGFMLMINNNNIIGLLRRSDSITLSKEDVFKIIPIFSGG